MTMLYRVVTNKWLNTVTVITNLLLVALWCGVFGHVTRDTESWSKIILSLLKDSVNTTLSTTYWNLQLLPTHPLEEQSSRHFEKK